MPAPRSQHALDSIMRPRAVAVIGASRRKQTIGYEILSNLLGFEFSGPVYPVNPTTRVVHSIRAYRRVGDIPGPVDLAVVVVPKRHVLGVVDACGRKGVRGLVMITAGFREADEEGAALERRLHRRVSKYGMRMVGPNCMGVINTEPSVRLNATFASAVPHRGNVGFISQSGALGEAILADATQSGLGVAMFVSLGNKTDVSGNDLLEYWSHNDDVQAILMYLESFGDPRRFIKLARNITRRKPIITVKSGRTAAGARAVSSHTGAIVGRDVATESLLEQCGVLRVSSLNEMFVQATALAQQPLPRGDRVAIVTNAGGPAILCTDACVGRGLQLAEFRASTRRALARSLPSQASVRNPVDMIASADAATYRKTLQGVIGDPEVDGVIVIFVSPIMIDAYEVARAICDHAESGKPILSVFMGKQRSAEGIAELRKRRVPVYRFPDDAASAMAALSRYRRLREAPQGREVRYKVDRDGAARAIESARRARRRHLSNDEVHRVLEAYGFPVAPQCTVKTAEEAAAAARELGYPVVLKAASTRLIHKTEVDGVKLDLRNDAEVVTSFLDLSQRLRPQAPDLRITVQRFVPSGREVILGMTHEPQFGPLLMFGLGGVDVEVLRDVSVAVHPLTDITARRMIEKLRGYPLLAGTRGKQPVAIPLLRSSLLRLSQLVSDFEGDLAELDLNPFIITASRKSSFVVDARIALRPRGRGR